ncbi:hypothetical protein [Dyadobacter sp. MSC1_007]|jgi:hypothetical protein|uniref:hypothetical protein n=1 Tax=Dyadobacter sp. MSC1_007 TaxID=2909264 RepID=UPI00202F8DBD|nr:hypothetical protein [Dyadobacter sp. MSC1_007]
MKLILTLAMLGFALVSHAQGVALNSDGTHSHIINNGSTSIIVNSNGTHSTAFNNGNTSIIVNPNGTHSTSFHNGNTSIIVNPNGTHSTAFHNGNTSVVFTPNGTTTTVFHNDPVGDEEETESPRRPSYGYARPWGRGPVVPEDAFVDLSQWKSGPVLWINVRRNKRK